MESQVQDATVRLLEVAKTGLSPRQTQNMFRVAYQWLGFKGLNTSEREMVLFTIIMIAMGNFGSFGSIDA